MPLPAEYAETVFLLEDAPVTLPAEFAIITAWNPLGRARPGPANRAADRDLQEALKQLRAPHFRATGCSPDLKHREPGWAVRSSLATALGLGKRFDQLAIWWIRDDELVLVDCSDSTEHATGSFTPRIRSTP